MHRTFIQTSFIADDGKNLLLDDIHEQGLKTIID